MYTLKGEIKVINEVQQISDSFKKREFVVTDSSGQYAQEILFQLVQDRCGVLDQFVVGNKVEVTFFLRGREWKNPKDDSIRYFNTLDAWKIENLESETKPETFTKEGDDDLPF